MIFHIYLWKPHPVRGTAPVGRSGSVESAGPGPTTRRMPEPTVTGPAPPDTTGGNGEERHGINGRQHAVDSLSEFSSFLSTGSSAVIFNGFHRLSSAQVNSARTESRLMPAFGEPPIGRGCSVRPEHADAQAAGGDHLRERNHSTRRSTPFIAADRPRCPRTEARRRTPGADTAEPGAQSASGRSTPAPLSRSRTRHARRSSARSRIHPQSRILLTAGATENSTP